MATAAKKNFGLSSHNSGKTIEDKRRERARSAAGAVLLLIEGAVSMLVLALAVLSALVSLCG